MKTTGWEGKRDREKQKIEKSAGRAKMATQHALLSKDPKNVILFRDSERTP